MGMATNTWLAVVVVIGCVLSSGVLSELSSSNGTSSADKAPSPVQSSEPEFTGEFTGGEDPLQPSYILRRDGQPCLLATFNISLAISYKVPSSLPNQEADQVLRKELPAEAAVSGTCGQNRSTLDLSWENGTYTLELVFTVVEGSDNTTLNWATTNMTLTYSTENATTFADAIDRGETTMVREGLTLFSTPRGMSYLCEVDQKVLATDSAKIHGAAVTFYHVHLQPFRVSSEAFSNSTGCEEDSSIKSMQKERFIVPIVVAVSLVVIVLVVIASYAVSRRMNTARDQQAYRSMD